MADVTVYGFPISTYVNVVRLVLTHKAGRAISHCIRSAACRSSTRRSPETLRLPGGRARLLQRWRTGRRRRTATFSVHQPADAGR